MTEGRRSAGRMETEKQRGGEAMILGYKELPAAKGLVIIIIITIAVAAAREWILLSLRSLRGGTKRKLVLFFRLVH